MTTTYAQINFFLYKAIKYSNLDEDIKIARMSQASNASVQYFKDTDLRNDYENNEAAKACVEFGEYEEALKFSDDFKEQENSFNLQSLAKIHRGLGDFQKSQDFIEQAISFGRKSKVKPYYISSFYHDLYQTLIELGVIDEARTALEAAIELQPNGKTKKSWKEKLDEL